MPLILLVECGDVLEQHDSIRVTIGYVLICLAIIELTYLFLTAQSRFPADSVEKHYQ